MGDVARTNHVTRVTQAYSEKVIGNDTALVPYTVQDGKYFLLDNMDATTGWSVISDDTDNLATTTTHVLGTNALTFDKVDGTADTVIAGITKTLSSVDLSGYRSEDCITFSFLIPTLTDVAKVFIRLGTSASHYNEWQIDDSELTANTWLRANVPLGNVTSVTGNGWNQSSIDYIAIGVTFDAETDTLAAIIFDHIGVTDSPLSTGISSGLGSGVTGSDVNLTGIGGNTPTTGAGTVAAGTQRITLASDDPAVAALQIIDDWDETNRAAVNLIASQVGITGGAGAVAANTPRITLGSDDPAVALLGTIDADTGAIVTDVDAIAAAIKAEDSAHNTGDSGMIIHTVRQDTAAALSGTDGDYQPLITDANGRLHVTSSGGVAHDAADSGNPVKIGGKAAQTNPTAVADADRVDGMFDDLGKQVVVGSVRDLKVAQHTTITSSTSETTVLTAAAATFHDVYGVIVTNSSGTDTEVTFKDATTGTTRFVISAPGNDSRGFMLNESAAHNQSAVNNNWTATCADSVASIDITVMAVKNV